MADTTYEIHKTKDKTQWYWIQKARNGETLATSETYTRLQSALDGAKAAGAELPIKVCAEEGNG